MTSDKHFRLIVSLHNETGKGNVAWEESAEAGVFQVVFPNYTVKISRRRSAEANDWDYVMAITNDEGEMIDEVADTDFGGAKATEAFKTLREMYDTARRYSLGVEQALDEILRELEDDDLPF